MLVLICIDFAQVDLCPTSLPHPPAKMPESEQMRRRHYAYDKHIQLNAEKPSPPTRDILLKKTGKRPIVRLCRSPVSCVCKVA